MRIIAGEFRGRTILPPESDTTRPITDRAKQSLFDVLSPLLPDSIVYDCFAGTGSMGLECLSRGAAKAVFFEADRSAVKRLKQNIDALDVEARSQVIAGDLFKWFATQLPTEPKADLIFLDPPYRFLKEQVEALQALAQQFAQKYVKCNGTLIFRHDSADSLALPPFAVDDVRTYGSMTIELLRVPPA